MHTDTSASDLEPDESLALARHEKLALVPPRQVVSLPSDFDTPDQHLYQATAKTNESSH